jgi:hypothetical protein
MRPKTEGVEKEPGPIQKEAELCEKYRQTNDHPATVLTYARLDAA